VFWRKEKARSRITEAQAAKIREVLSLIGSGVEYNGRRAIVMTVYSDGAHYVYLVSRSPGYPQYEVEASAALIIQLLKRRALELLSLEDYKWVRIGRRAVKASVAKENAKRALEILDELEREIGA
jgi:hypothetical protein